MSGSLVASSLFVAILALVALPAFAAPIAIPLSNFSGSETVIDFNSLGFEEEITDQFHAQGVDVSGGLYATATGNSLFANDGGRTARNRLPPGLPTTVSISFNETVDRVGFQAVSNNFDLVVVTALAFSGGVLMETLFFNTSQTESFVGIEDLVDGIDQVVLTSAAGFAFFIDDFRFEPTPAPIPEPGTALLLGLGLSGLAMKRR